MNLGEKIYNLRKNARFSQEELAEKVNVTRQTISNWELGSTSPNPEQLKLLSKVFNVSVDYILDNEVLSSKCRRDSYGYEYVSKTKIKGVPLVHINLGLGRSIRKAKGIIAIGNISKGVFAFGGIAYGLVTLGGVSLGLLSFGAVSIGLLLALGGLSIGAVSIGGLAIGLFSIGGLSIGLYSIGGCAFGKYVACGDYAYGHIAIGNHVKGSVEFIGSEASSNEIRNVILEHFPKTWDLIVSIISNVRF